MSRIPDLGENLCNLPDIVAQYEKELQSAYDVVKIEGKTIETANRENPSWQLYYDQRKIELYALVKYIDSLVQKTRGNLFKKYKENYSRELTEREINRYIDNEQAYLQKYELYLEIKELYEKYESVVNAFLSRGYALNNITKIRVASLEDVIL